MFIRLLIKHRNTTSIINHSEIHVLLNSIDYDKAYNETNET